MSVGEDGWTFSAGVPVFVVSVVVLLLLDSGRGASA
jgi:hypothetical protein